jgi:hypothetical protein
MKLQASDITLYAVCLEGSPVRFDSNAKVIPFYGDQGEHADVNPYWAELTCMYTLWNECENSFFGVVNYRRNWEERCLSQAKDDTLYIPRHVTFPFSIQQQFSQGHGGGLDETVELSLELARDKKIPLTEEMLLEMWNQPKFFETLQVMGPNEVMQKYFDVVFDILLPIWEEGKDYFMSRSGYNKRGPAFLMERLLTAVFLNKEHFFGSQKIEEIPFVIYR